MGRLATWSQLSSGYSLRSRLRTNLKIKKMACSRLIPQKFSVVRDVKLDKNVVLWSSFLENIRTTWGRWLSTVQRGEGESHVPMFQCNMQSVSGQTWNPNLECSRLFLSDLKIIHGWNLWIPLPVQAPCYHSIRIIYSCSFFFRLIEWEIFASSIKVKISNCGFASVQKTGWHAAVFTISATILMGRGATCS